MAERLRQIALPPDGEGFNHAHDDALVEGTLSAGADAYMLLVSCHPPGLDTRRCLVKAGALYLAEGERYNRKRKPDQAERCFTAAHRIAATIDEMA